MLELDIMPRGKTDLSAAADVIQIFKGGHALATWPAGKFVKVLIVVSSR